MSKGLAIFGLLVLMALNGFLGYVSANTVWLVPVMLWCPLSGAAYALLILFPALRR